MSEATTDANRRIAKNTIFLYARMIIIMGITLYSSRVVLTTLGVEDFGIYNVVGGIVVMLGFVNQTLSVGTQRFVTFALGKNDKRLIQQTFSTSLFIYALLVLILVILAETIGLWYVNNIMVLPSNRIMAANVVFQCTILSCCFSFFQVPFLSEVIAHEDMNFYAVISVIESVLKLLAVLFLGIFHIDHLVLYALLLLLIQCIIFIAYVRVTLAKYEVNVTLRPEKTMIRSMADFCGWNLFGSVSSVFSTQGVNMILNLFFGPACNAARGIAVQVNNAVNMFVSSFQTAVNPRITKLSATGDVAEEFLLISRSSKFSFVLVEIVVLPIMLNLDYVLHIWLGNYPKETDVFCAIVLLQTVILTLDRPVVTGIYATGKMKLANLTSGVLYLLNFPLSYLFLKMGFDSYVVFIIATVLQPVILMTDLYVFNFYTKFPIRDFLFKIVFPSIMTFVFVVLISYFTCLRINTSFLKLVLSTGVSWSILFGITYLLVLNNSEKEFIKKIIKSKFTNGIK